MKTFLNGLLGFLLVAVALSLFTTWQLTAILLLYIATVQQTFFPLKYSHPAATLIGMTIGMELLVSYHVGIPSLLAVFLWGLTSLFHELLRFTSEYGRFIVSVTLFILLYPLFMLSATHYVSYLPQLFTTLVITIIVTGGIQVTRHKPEYELV